MGLVPEGPPAMSDFAGELTRRLEALRAAGLYRELRRVERQPGTNLTVAGRRLVDFSANDYLGLADHPALLAAATAAVARQGAGARASRLMGGSLGVHHELEEGLAAWKGTAAALVFATGYATALGTIPALVGRDDVVVMDKLVHACVVDAARLSGAKLRVYPHNDLDRLEAMLRWADARTAGGRPLPGTRPRTLVITESVFSMDGDQAPLREIVALKERHGAWLMLDEAHAAGLLGATRRGLAEAVGVADRIEVQMGTLGKALGAAGGYICGSRPLVDYLVNRARSFIFSTAPVPAAAGAAHAAVQLVQSDEGAALVRQLWANVAAVKHAGGLAAGPATSAILPLLIGDEGGAVRAAAALRESGIFLPAVRFPTVPRGAARLRLTVSAAHTAGDVAALATALTRLNHLIRPPGFSDASAGPA